MVNSLAKLVVKLCQGMDKLFRNMDFFFIPNEYGTYRTLISTTI